MQYFTGNINAAAIKYLFFFSDRMCNFKKELSSSNLKIIIWDFIKLKRYELVLIAHLHMRIAKIGRVGESARILPLHVKEGDIRGKSTSFL